MGGLDKWRNFLLALFPSCFRENWEEGKEVCVCMVDLMMGLAPSVISQRDVETFDTEYITRKMERMVVQYQNNEEDPKRPLVKTALIAMIDTFHKVPKNKSATQKSRDGDQAQHMNKVLYDEMTTLHEQDHHLFISNNNQEFAYPLQGNTVWRSDNLKLQLYRLITHHLLHIPVKKDKVLIIDDGLAFSKTDFDGVRQRMLDDHPQFKEKSEFEQDWLVHQLMIHSKNFVTRFMVWDDGSFRRFDATGTGEADIKIQHYIRRDNGAKRFLVVNQDTDIIFILLLHMHTLLHDDETDEEIEVWIDTRSPSDKVDARPYRYIDVKKLYYAIHRLFKKEYPCIRYPIDMFCFLVFSHETDFTRRFPVCLQVNETLIWNTFSELHSVNETFITFTSKLQDTIKRSNKYTISKTHFGMLNDTVQYDAVKRQFILKHQKIKGFYFLLCQLRIMRIQKDLRISNGHYDNHNLIVAINCNELRIYARDICERLDKFKNYETLQQKALDEFFIIKKRPAREVESTEPPPVEKRFKLSSSLAKKTRLNISNTPTETDQRVDLDEDEIDKKIPAIKQSYLLDDTSYLRSNEKMLRLHAKKELPDEYYGVPDNNEMLARIYRIEWYMAYCRNGWRNSGDGFLHYDETAKQDPSLSLWGWKSRPISDEEEHHKMMNSTYCVSRYAPKESPSTVFVLYEVVETNQVYHKRYS